jgi:hypothetical protein
MKMFRDSLMGQMMPRIKVKDRTVLLRKGTKGFGQGLESESPELWTRKQALRFYGQFSFFRLHNGHPVFSS